MEDFRERSAVFLSGIIPIGREREAFVIFRTSLRVRLCFRAKRPTVGYEVSVEMSSQG